MIFLLNNFLDFIQSFDLIKLIGDVNKSEK